tara:strand:+ start:453 stop:572 length:120 start_codon:yes stop_codon:yes gene_type:complete
MGSQIGLVTMEKDTTFFTGSGDYGATDVGSAYGICGIYW